MNPLGGKAHTLMPGTKVYNQTQKRYETLSIALYVFLFTLRNNQYAFIHPITNDAYVVNADEL